MRQRRRPVLDGPRRRPEGPLPDLDRRRALALLAAGMSATLAACSRPEEEILPYVDMPERLVPGEPLRFATTLPLAGYGRGVIAISREGRPIKIEGNPRHPASLGATDVFAEADVLDLYDPSRAQAVREQGRISSWSAFSAALLSELERHAADGGGGLRLLTGRVTSPSLLRQIGELRKRFPNARWARFEPIDDDPMRAGARLAFGRTLTALPDLAAADVVLALDADPLGAGPEQIFHARRFAERRTVRRAGEPGHGMARLYAVEACPSLTGASADHRLSLPPAMVTRVALAVAAELGAGLGPPELPSDLAVFAAAAAGDLARRPGRGLFLVGPSQPPEIHALGHWLNRRLGAPVRLIEPVDPVPDDHGASLAALVEDMSAGRVRSLVILATNPVHTAPAGLGFREALRRVPFTVAGSTRPDETTEACGWHLPLSHPLEAWSDLRAVDGTASIVQPLILPLHATRTAHEILALLLGRTAASPHAVVRETWRPAAGDDVEAWWRSVLVAGVVPGSAAPPVSAPEPRLPPLREPAPASGPVLAFRPDPTVWDGSYAGNAWLQECPKPLTKQVWGNAFLMAPATLAAHGLAEGGGIRVEAGGRAIEGPALAHPGMAPGVIAVTLGYGRAQAGEIGSGLGIDAYAIRRHATPWVDVAVEVAPAATAGGIVRLQHSFEEHRREGIVKVVELAALAHGLDLGPEVEAPSFYPPLSYERPPYPAPAWAMVIDTTLCIGCNACVIACQAENNVPVVGPVEAERGRDMHWLRIDAYLSGEGSARPVFQPVPCMHCEEAPCEPVCPVEASVHDHEGLNVQVYNRCIGTRFCQANCPYKVRRFNFFDYADGQAFADLGAPSVQAQRNPEVTVRSRGVMEKCTYCVQRISRARIAAEREGRQLAEGEVVTACAAACPTRAIRFGDLARPDGAIARLRAEPQHYTLLGHLGTRPRTTYLARVRNPNPELEPGKA